MADKQQNITVNYKFNVADVERASATLSRANQASNQLQQAGQKAGQSISQGFGQARRSITSMETELARLKTMVEVSSDPKRTAALSAEYKNLALQVRAAKKELLELPKEQKKVTEAAKSNTQAFGGLLTTVRAVFTAGIAREAFNIAMNMAELAGNVEGVERAFSGRFANAPALLRRLQDATQGTIKDFELMQRTLLATNLGISVQALPQLLEFATRRAAETGQSVDDLTDRIVRGIGVKSTKILDDLGINARRLKDALGGVSMEAATVGQVTEAVGRIAQEELNKMGDAAVNSATRVKQMKVAWDDLYLALSKSAPTGWVTELATITAKGLTDAVKMISSLAKEGNPWDEIDKGIVKTKASLEAAAVVDRDAYKEFKDNAEGKIGYLAREITLRLNQVNEYDTLMKKEADRANELLNSGKRITYAQDEEIRGITETIKRQESKRDIIKQVIEFLREYVIELRNIQEEEKKGEETGIIERKRKEIEGLEQAILKTNKAADLSQINIDKDGNATMQVGRLVQKLEIAKAELADLQRVFSDIDVKPLKARIKEASDDFLDFEANIKRIENSIQELNLAPRPADTVAQLDTFWTNMGEMWNENWRNLVADSADFQANAINSMLESEVRAMDSQIAGLKAHYKQRQDLAGDNERAKSELRIKEDREVQRIQKAMFEREKRIRRAQTVVDGAAAAIKAFATAPNVYIAIAQAALIAATTIAQLRVIDKEQPRFAKGVINLQGPGTGTSDSIPARLSKGESVMTAWETKYAGDVLKDVRAKRLDNKVLRDLKQGRERPVITPVHDDSKIIAAIEANKPPDVVEQSNIVYEVRQHSDTLRRKQRSKSMNI